MFLELRLMFSLMDRVPDGITQMLVDLENYIFHQGLADMMAAAESITTVSYHIIFVNECNYKLNSNQVKLCRSVLLIEETRENELIKGTYKSTDWHCTGWCKSRFNHKWKTMWKEEKWILTLSKSSIFIKGLNQSFLFS